MFSPGSDEQGIDADAETHHRDVGDTSMTKVHGPQLSDTGRCTDQVESIEQPDTDIKKKTLPTVSFQLGLKHLGNNDLHRLLGEQLAERASNVERAAANLMQAISPMETEHFITRIIIFQILKMRMLEMLEKSRK